ncbi:MAG: CopG family transcriptional regulator [Bacteroidota bacterium]
MKMRLNCYFSADLYDSLDALAHRKGLHKSSIVEAALASFLSPDAADQREAAFTRRLDRISRQIERLERDLGISVEALALFVRFWLSVSPPIPDGAKEAARARGAERYAGFVETLGRRVQKGHTLLREISEDIVPAGIGDQGGEGEDA